MKLLAIDTSAKAASAALLENGVLLGECFTNSGLTHSQTLMPMVRQLLSNCRTALGDIDLFALSGGPGSFTGLRIGMAAVKGMAFGRDVPCVKVSTLEGLCYLLPEWRGVLCPVMDARCGQVYNALFSWESGRLIRRAPDRAISVAQLAGELGKIDEPILLLGDGELVFSQVHLPSLSLAGAANRFQRAAGVGLCACEKAKAGQVQSPESLRPDYLRLPQAERERLEREEIEKERGKKS